VPPSANLNLLADRADRRLRHGFVIAGVATVLIAVAAGTSAILQGHPSANAAEVEYLEGAHRRNSRLARAEPRQPAALRQNSGVLGDAACVVRFQRGFYGLLTWGRCICRNQALQHSGHRYSTLVIYGAGFVGELSELLADWVGGTVPHRTRYCGPCWHRRVFVVLALLGVHFVAELRDRRALLPWCFSSCAGPGVLERPVHPGRPDQCPASWAAR